jgi:DNA-binding NtrC family response regulator
MSQLMKRDAKILVVDEARETAERIRTALGSITAFDLAGAEVEWAGSTAEALKVLEAGSPEMIFLGRAPDDATGFGALRAIRECCSGSPIIMLVRDGDHAAGVTALGSGAQDYLFESEERGDVIERSLVRAVERRRVEEEYEDSGWRSGIGRTVRGLQHEINNPLASLILNLEMLKEGGHEDADELLDGIEVAAKRIAAIVRSLEGNREPERNAVSGDDGMTRLSGGSTILLVDDEESVRAIVTKILTKQGHKLLEAEHGADAVRLAACHDGKIDLLITDMYMPGLRGPEIFEKLRETRPDIGVLYMSGYGDEDVARSGVALETGFLKKPFTVQELRDAVTKALSEPGA